MKKYFQAPWTAKDISRILLTTAILMGSSIYFVNQFGLSDNDIQGWILMPMFLLQWVVMLLPIYIFTRGKHKLSTETFGIKKVGLRSTVSLVIKGYLLYLAINFLIGILIVFKGIEIPGYQVQEEILPLFGSQTIDLVLAGTIIILVAPVIEEIVFRGFLLRGLVNHYGKVIGSVVAAFIFSALHFPWQSFIPIFILGLVMNSMVIKSKSIIPSIVFHMTNNAIAFSLQVAIMKNPNFLEDAFETSLAIIEKLV
jgi:uncharacterized protein